MDEREAFERLGLDSDASEAEIDAAFRRIAKSAHPDIGGGHDEMVELSLARQVALASIRSKSLVPYAAIVELAQASNKALQRQEKQIDSQQKIEASRRTVSRIVRHYTSRYKRYRRGAAFIAWVSLGIGILSARILPGLEGTLLDSPTLGSIFLGLAVVMALYYWMFYVSAQNIQQAIEDVGESLEDKPVYVDLIYEIADRARVDPPWRDRPWSRREMMSLVSRWAGSTHGPMPPLLPRISRAPSIRRLARIIGVAEFIRLLISKGIARDTLEEHEKRSRGRILVGYSLPLESPEENDAWRDRGPGEVLS